MTEFILMVVIFFGIKIGVTKVLTWLFRDEYETKCTWRWWDM